MVCISCALSNCPGWVQMFAWFGVLFAYLIIGYLMSCIIVGAIYRKRWCELDNDETGMAVLGGFFWPVTIAIGVIWWACIMVTLPWTVAKKKDIERLETKIERIPVQKAAVVQTKNQPIKKFKVGDLVTGVKGNPDNYKHLYEGCVCRVMSIDDKGSMKLLLINHQDKEAHEDKIGEIFTAPSRNFVLKKKK